MICYFLSSQNAGPRTRYGEQASMMRMRNLVRLCSGFSSACCIEGRATPNFREISALVIPDLTRNRLANEASSLSEMTRRFDMDVVVGES